MSEHIGFLLNDTARLYRRAFNARSREDGCTALQWRLMMYIRREPGIRQGPVAELIEVEPITLSRMVDRLQESGLVERRHDPSDRRAWLLYLTPQAEKLMQGIRHMIDDLESMAMDGLTAPEQAELKRLVAKVQSNLSNRTACPAQEK
ncbi:MarR family winged helix-turn-helix transcriptional regulator [Sphingopyxis yananensis]|uniref:MarR family winged helix-turn-helix transcriptional regulator n=1 Tax=Sphingopyxis yananensis TaxID=2886687 RepID=UPI001D0FAEE0|nr:MarR family transcriptional regulator [Sphingopyxis yananensis]MCC2602883.1 MarR family transcriptional regulator [Sphingopyxis yananensis]